MKTVILSAMIAMGISYNAHRLDQKEMDQGPGRSVASVAEASSSQFYEIWRPHNKWAD